MLIRTRGDALRACPWLLYLAPLALCCDFWGKAALKVRYRRLFRSFRAQRKYPDLTRGDVPSSLASGFHIAAPLALRESDMTFEAKLRCTKVLAADSADER